MYGRWEMYQKFPKEFFAETYEGDGYPHYKWRNDGKYVRKNGVPLNSKWVVPYNPFLSRKYNTHINVEICSSIKSCKYLYKYVYKGPDMASVAVYSQLQNDTQQGDEIHKYVNSQLVTASEAYWRIFEFDIHGQKPSVQCLAVHQKNSQTVIFGEAHPEEAIANLKQTTLLGWFKLNRTDPNARNFKSHEIPESTMCGILKVRNGPRGSKGSYIGHMYTTNPSKGA